MKTIRINNITAEIANLTTGYEGSLFHVEKQVEYDGVEMGVLENGIPYLSENGLARLCGISRPTLRSLAASWPEEKTKKRGQGDRGDDRTPAVAEKMTLPELIWELIPEQRSR